MADAFARTGDDELYKYSTSLGTGAPYDPLKGGPKSLLLVLKRFCSYLDQTCKRTIYGDVIDGIVAKKNWYLANDVNFAKYNLYYNDPYLKKSIQEQLQVLRDILQNQQGMEATSLIVEFGKVCLAYYLCWTNGGKSTSISKSRITSGDGWDSLSALTYVANTKGYALIGCTLAGNNAYYVRRDLLNERIKEVSEAEAYKESRYRESRNIDSTLSYLEGNKRYEAIKGLDVLNVKTNQIEKL